MMASRIATGMYFLGDLFPEIAKAYEDCEELQEDIERLQQIHDRHFKNSLASLETFADIYGVMSTLKDQIMPYTTELGNGKNAAKIAQIVAATFPRHQGQIMQ